MLSDHLERGYGEVTLHRFDLQGSGLPFDEAQQLVKEGDEAFIKGRNAHLQLLAHNAKGQNIPINLLLIHAEDQLSDTETVRTLADKFIDVYRRLQQMEV